MQIKISKEKLETRAKESGFRPEILEKVWNLMNVLDEISAHPLLKNCLVLKGGTALNLFLFNLPRLSIDIDLNYVGQSDRGLMQADGFKVDQALKLICENMGMRLTRSPNSPAGSKWDLVHNSVLGYKDTLEVDLNYVNRTPLWTPQKMNSTRVVGEQTTSITLLSLEELAAGKISELFSKKSSRDLFDSYYLLHKLDLDKQKLRTAVLLYGLMCPRDFRQVSLNNINFDEAEVHQKLVPLLRKDAFDSESAIFSWAGTMVKECRNAVKDLIDFNDSEKAFLDDFYDNGILTTSRITNDTNLIRNVEQHPLIRWRMQVLAHGRVVDSKQESGVKV